MIHRRPIILFLAFLFWMLVPWIVHGEYRASVGWERLATELGEAVPTGKGITVSLIESGTFGAYMPDTGNFEFAGKAFNAMSGESGTSNHATVVAQRFFGAASSMSPAIDTIDVYEATDWLYEGFLNTTRNSAIQKEIRRIQNHSWTGEFENHAENVKAIRRFDRSIAGDGYLAIVALGNDTGTLPPLLAHSYNAISVGRPGGQHNRGGTWIEEDGRTRPDLVSPGGFFTSYSAPVVASAGALLLDVADRTPGLVNARRNPEVVRAILLAGASKEPFPYWSRTGEKPLDEIVGAGQLDVHRAYRILTGGETVPGNGETAPASGWSRRFVSSGESESYAFSFDRTLVSFTAHAAWNRLIEAGGNGCFLDAKIQLARFELRLFATDADGTGALVQASLDPANNNQHLYIENLPAGDYLLRIDRPAGFESFEVACAIAWDAIKPPPVTFTEWRHDHFTESERNDPEISGADADPDGDGVPNLLEYALGGNPLSAGRRVLPKRGIATINGMDYLALTFTRPDGLEDIDYFVDASDDLVEWTEGTGILEVSKANPDGTIAETYRDPVPLGGNGRRHLRLRILPRLSE